MAYCRRCVGSATRAWRDLHVQHHVLEHKHTECLKRAEAVEPPAKARGLAASVGAVVAHIEPAANTDQLASSNSKAYRVLRKAFGVKITSATGLESR